MAIVVMEAQRAPFPRERYRARMAVLLAGVKKQSDWSYGARKVVLANLLTVCSDLWLTGARSLDPRNLGAKHLDGLIQVWQQGAVSEKGQTLRKPLSRKAASQLWTAVGHWCNAIGKRNIRLPFREAWREDVESCAPVVHGRNGALLLRQIDEATYQDLLAAWQTKPGRTLNYWLARVVRELGSSVAEAVRFSPTRAVQAGGTCIVVNKWAATSSRVIELDTPEKAALVRDLVAYMRHTKMHRLCWPRDGSDGVESLEAAEVKFRESVRYQVHRIESARSAIQQPEVIDEPA